MKETFTPVYKIYMHCPRCGALVEKDEIKEVYLRGANVPTSAMINCCNQCFMKIITKYRYY